MANGFMTTFGGDNTGFIRAVKGMEQATGKMASSVAGSLKGLVGAYVGVEAFKAMIGNAVKAALAFDDFSDRQNTTFEETQRLVAAFKRFGLEAGDAESALMKLAGTRQSAAEGDDKMISAFQKYGISMDDLNNASLTNFDLMKKIGVTMKDMSVNPALMADMKELFGKSGAKLIGGLKELGEGRDIPLIGEEAKNSMDDADKAFERMKDNWNAIAAAPIGGALKHLADTFEGLKGQGLMKSAGELMLLQYTTRMAFWKNVAASKPSGASGSWDEDGTDPQFTDKRPAKIAAAQQDLDNASRDALIEQLQPLERQVAYRKQIVDLLEKADFIEAHMGENLESIALRKQALGLESKTKDDGGGGGSFSRPDKMNIDDMAKNNLSLGIKAYEPMMNATRMNTAATVANTVELAKTGGFLSALQNMNSVDPWS